MAERLKPAEMRAWIAFLDAQATVLRRLESDLMKADRMTLAEYDVLIQLWLAPEKQLRMSELSLRVRLSPSGITRLVDRLVKAGLVRRVRCASDRRGAWAMLTSNGRRRLARARPNHLRSVHRHFAGLIKPAQLPLLAETLEKLADRPAVQVSSTA
jgi:DNA-binding MarR family transcriptional regulator